MKFWGYRRTNGSVGVRNHVLVFPTVICASTVAQMISREVPGTVSVTHAHGCGHLGEYKRAAYVGRVWQEPNMGTACKLTIEENLSLALLRGQSRGLRGAVNKQRRQLFRETLALLDMPTVILASMN